MQLNLFLIATMALGAVAVPAPAPTPAARLEDAAVFAREMDYPHTESTAKCLECPGGGCCKTKRAMMPRATNGAKRWLIEFEEELCKHQHVPPDCVIRWN